MRQNGYYKWLNQLGHWLAAWYIFTKYPVIWILFYCWHLCPNGSLAVVFPVRDGQLCCCASFSVAQSCLQWLSCVCSSLGWFQACSSCGHFPDISLSGSVAEWFPWYGMTLRCHGNIILQQEKEDRKCCSRTSTCEDKESITSAVDW